MPSTILRGTSSCASLSPFSSAVYGSLMRVHARSHSGKNFGSYVTHVSGHFVYFYLGNLAMVRLVASLRQRACADLSAHLLGTACLQGWLAEL